jgi:hypothetical protein
MREGFERKLSLELELHVARLLKIWKPSFNVPKKNMKILDVTRDVFYNRLKFQCKRPYTLGYIKITSSNKFWEFWKGVLFTNMHFCHFCVAQRIWSFKLNFAHLWDTSQATFRLFWNFKTWFSNFQKKSYMKLELQKSTPWFQGLF